MRASGFGLGQLVSHAPDAGCTSSLTGVSGTASTDGAAGLPQALGARLADAQGHELPRGGGLARLDTIDLRPLDPRLRSCRRTTAADVSSPLLEPSGAAHVLGPQKGARPPEVAALERGLQALSRAVAAVPGQGHVTGTATGPGGGAGGGIAWALETVLAARAASSAETILDLIGFDRAAEDTELVVTGEGVLDMSLAGGAPAVVARRAKDRGLPVIAVTGQCTLPGSRWREAGIDAVCELAALAGSPDKSLAATPWLLRETGRRIALREMTATGPVPGGACEAT